MTEKYTSEDGNRYEATYDPESGKWDTGYTDAAGVWHDVPVREMPLEAFTEEQLEDLKYSADAQLSPQQREAVDKELHERAIDSGEIHTYTTEDGNRYEASQEPETGRWHTGYTDQDGIWHDVPAREMPLEAFTAEQLEDLKYSADAGLSPQQREAVDKELHERAISPDVDLVDPMPEPPVQPTPLLFTQDYAHNDVPSPLLETGETLINDDGIEDRFEDALGRQDATRAAGGGWADQDRDGLGNGLEDALSREAITQAADEGRADRDGIEDGFENALRRQDVTQPADDAVFNDIRAAFSPDEPSRTEPTSDANDNEGSAPADVQTGLEQGGPEEPAPPMPGPLEPLQTLNANLLDPIAPGPTLDYGLVERIEQNPQLLNEINQNEDLAYALEADPTRIEEFEQNLSLLPLDPMEPSGDVTSLESFTEPSYLTDPDIGGQDVQSEDFQDDPTFW